MRINIVLLLLFCSKLLSHPHTFITNEYDITLNQDGIEVITLIWHFDEMFSESILLDYDQDHNRAFEGDEIEDIYNNAFINLKNYNYFLDIKVENENVIIDSVSGFKAYMEEYSLVYEFSINIPAKPATSNQKVQLMCYDPTYYIMISTYSQTGLTINNSSSLKFRSEIFEQYINFENYGELPVCTVKIIIEH